MVNVYYSTLFWSVRSPYFPHMQALNFLDFLLGVWDKRKFRDVSIDSECTNWLQLLLGLVDITRDHSHTLLNKFFGKTVICKKYRRLIVKQVRMLPMLTHLKLGEAATVIGLACNRKFLGQFSRV